jgi:lipopolysaccharide transport system permease protein
MTSTTEQESLTQPRPTVEGTPVIAASPVTKIMARRPLSLPLRGLWEFRELLYFLTWRDIKVRYKQTAIGAAWAIIQPLVTMVIFTAVFHRVARIDTGSVPYPIFAFAGLLPWNLFAGALQRSIQSLVTSAPLITKVYFPRLVVPVAATFAATVDFLVAFGVLIAMAVWYGMGLTWRIALVPAVVALALLTALAVGLWLSALNVRYRDIGHAIPFVIQAWMFASPVAYPTGLVPDRWQLLYGLNPMVGVIQLFRWSLLGGQAPDPRSLAVSATATAVLLLGGLVFFHRMERTFADTI